MTGGWFMALLYPQYCSIHWKNTQDGWAKSVWRTWSGLHLPWRPSALQWSHHGPGPCQAHGAHGGMGQVLPWTNPCPYWFKKGRNRLNKNLNHLVGLRKKIRGKSHISWENLWFPVDFPLSQPIDWNFENLQSSLAAVFEPARTSDGNSCQCLARPSITS